MNDAPATRFPSLGRPSLPDLAAVRRLLRTPSLARSVVILLAGALSLLLLANFSTFVLIQRTAEINAQVDATWQVRRAARSVLLNVEEAETAQRGYLLTAQPGFLAAYENARAVNEPLFEDLERTTEASHESRASADELRRLTDAKFQEMSRTLGFARQGRIGEAVSIVRAGRGQEIMAQLRAELGRIDRLQGEAVEAEAAQSRLSAVVTITVNFVAGVLILILGAIIVVLVRRYLAEINDARATVARINAGLEDTVRSRTAALTRANEEVQRFAYIVSHDLRSPLVNVMGYTSELEQAGKTLDLQMTKVEAGAPDLIDGDAVLAVREDIPEAVGFIRASTEKMDRLINAILKLSREGRRNLTPEALDMTAMVQRIADSMHHQVSEVGAEIVVEPMAGMENDRLSIEQIMGNLIDNAVKYLDPARPGRIVVTGTERAGGWVEYAVQDNGRGIAARDHERVFELFRRAGRQDTKGEGLGLAFVRNSVRRLGGEITVDSELGKGSTFRLKFPKRLVLDEAGDTL